MPTWLSGKQLVITRTQNGWAVGPEKNTLPEQCVAFETWAALAYWLEANWGSVPQV